MDCDSSIDEVHRCSDELADAIRAACAARGDSEHECAALLAECLTLNAAGQADMLEHFRSTARNSAETARQETSP